MRKNVFWSLLTLLLTSFVFYSCSTKEDAPQSEETNAVTFEFDANMVVSKTAPASPDYVAVPGYELCKTPNVPMKVSIKLAEVADPIILDVKSFDGVYKTDPYELPANKTYTVSSVIVYNSVIPSQVIYSGVVSPSLLSTFVPGPTSGPTSYFMGQQQFTLLPYTKPTVKLYVLCTKDYNATDFGMPKFEINRIEVTCFDIFFNVCDKNREHVVGKGMVEVYDHQGGRLLYSDEFNGGTLDQHGNPTSAGNLATICFGDDLTKDNATESYYIKITFTNPDMLNPNHVFSGVATVEELLKFKQSPRWDVSMNALHLMVCDEGTFCLLPRVICECSGALYEDFQTYSDINDFYERSGWTRPAGQNDVLHQTMFGNKYILAVSPADINKDKETFKWTTSLFKYINGHKIQFNFYYKEIMVKNSDVDANVQNECPDHVKAKVIVKLYSETNQFLGQYSDDVYLGGSDFPRDWELFKTFSFNCQVPSQCAKAEISVQLEDGFKWVRRGRHGTDTDFVSYKFGLDNVESGAFGNH